MIFAAVKDTGPMAGMSTCPWTWNELPAPALELFVDVPGEDMLYYVVSGGYVQVDGALERSVVSPLGGVMP